MLYLGCDQHRKQVTVSLRNEEGNRVLRRQVSTRPEKMRAFLKSVQEQAGGEGWMAIVEVCGFNDWFLALLEECGCREIVLLHAEKRSKKKTDRRDADQLAQLLWINRERVRQEQPLHGLRRVLIPSREDTQDRQLTALRQRLGRRRTRTINALKRILRKHNLEWEQPTREFDTQAVRRWLRELELPEVDRWEMDLLLQEWELWERQFEEVEEKLESRASVRRDVALMQTVPGLSYYGALGLAARIGDVDRFPRPRSLANYFGLTPGCRNSGEKQDRLGSITKQGSQFARFILGQAVQHVLKKDRQMQQWYRRIKRRRGSKIARVAVMRRLCTILWHMLKNQETYVSGGPPRLRQRRRSTEKACVSS